MEGKDNPGLVGLVTDEPSGIGRFVPIVHWLPRYQRTWLRADAIAGLTLWGLVVPEAMAYAGIAGLPPQAGLYTLVASMLIYALFGTSRHLSLGGTSATAALLASSVAAVIAASAATTRPIPQTYPAYAAAFVLVVGVVFLAAGLARLGFITQFLSKPVMDGFVVGLGDLRRGRAALQALRRREGPRATPSRSSSETLKELPEANWTDCRGRRGVACAALPAAATEQEDPGRSGRALRGDRAELGARSRGQLRRRGRRHAAGRVCPR